MEKPSELIEDMLLDSEVVVRVELATVTLAARAWAELRVGDILQTSVRLEEPVVLRVEGRELARGELVNVDGHVGVRLTRVF